MPKQKTHKGLKKRVTVTATGKLKRKSAGSGHLMSSKSAKRRRKLSRPALIDKTKAKVIRAKLGV
ncbi:MAG: 50S ribosomal protein L35 [Candidatus Brocadiia bacterium]|nr:MAG: 50S ribosomal protein L35 [Candidatus Brocadiia bacterium]